MLVLVFLIGIALYDMFSGKPQYANSVDSQYMESYQRQLKNSEQQIKEGARQLEINNTHLERMGILLERWEKQADRYDAILEKWEKQNGIELD